MPKYLESFLRVSCGAPVSRLRTFKHSIRRSCATRAEQVLGFVSNFLQNTGKASGTRAEQVVNATLLRDFPSAALCTANVEFLVRASKFNYAAGLSCVSTWFDY